MKKIPTVKFLSVLMVLILASFISCSEDSPTDPKEQEANTLSSKTISSSGGSITTDNVEIEIPSGTFSSSQEIKILESTEDNMFGAEAFSDFYTLDGLPLETNEPIKIKMKYSGTITDSSFIAIGEKNFTSSLNAETTSYQFISARDSAGYLIATIPPLLGSTLEKDVSQSSINGDKLAINIGAIGGYVSYLSEQGHFKINFPSSVLTQAYDLADYLEKAYTKFIDLGFSYSRRTKWPVQINVKQLKSTTFGYSYNSVWGDNYGYMEFNFDKMDDKENLKLTAGHEFFHLVQSLYDPRNRYSKAKFFTPHLWLDEASSVWAEELFTGTSSFTSPLVSDNIFDVFNGAKTGNDKSLAAEYGYGMASIIKYVTKEYGNDKLVEVYDNIYSGKSAFLSLSKILPINVGYSWHSFLKSLITLDLYSGDSFRPGLIISYSTGEKQKFIIKSAADSLKSYKSKLPDLSATIFSVDNQFGTMAENSVLEFKCKDWNFQLYKVNSTKCEFLMSGKDILAVENYKELTDEGYKIISVLYNDDYDSPFENSKEYEMEIRLKTNVKIKSISIGIAYSGSFTSAYPDTTYNTDEQRTIEGIYNGGAASITGNTFTATTSTSVGIYNQVSTISLSFDNIEDPKEVISFSINNEGYDTYANATINESATGQNLMSPYKQGNLIQFGTYGNISSYISTLTHSNSRLYEYTEPDGTPASATVIYQLVDYKSEGSISIYIEYE